MVEQQLGYRYQFIEEIGRGVLFSVYKARDRLTGRVVALKVVNEAWARSQQFRERFRECVEPNLNIPHPNLTRYLNIGEAAGTLYLSCEYVPGESLAAILHRRALIPVTQALRIGIQACDALTQLHELGVVHGDLRPEHILITHRGEVKLTDYALHEVIASEKLLEAEWVRKAIYYLPPERFEEDIVELAGDIYSLGIVLFQAVTGVLPFRGGSMTDIATMHLSAPPPLPSDLNPAVPRVVERAILRALEKDQAKRFSSAQEMGNALREAISALDQVSVSVPAMPVRTEVEERQQVSVSLLSKALITIAGSIIGMFLLALIIWWLLVGTPPSEVSVPDVVGMPLSVAQQRMAEVGLHLRVAQTEYSHGVPANHVISMIGVEPGKLVRRGRVIDVVVSSGPEQVLVPNVLDLPADEAQQRISSEGLVPRVVGRTYSEVIAEGYIVGQQPPHGYRLPKGEVVQLVVSMGRPPQLPEPKILPGHKGARVTVSVGKGQLLQTVEIEVIDEDGRRVVYKGEHVPGDLVTRTVVGKGAKVAVRVYVNGRLVREEML
ncbi:MAG: protein kinase [Armatimonadota bacterium]|nr:protein kinase [Armatimonadota bacterium]MCX7777423.1 protein kinase [Armatimonadota bacterium]MDW8025092.1 protein kinase [Armatimonadota bacterium]